MHISKSARLAALRLHALHPKDRRWILNELSIEEREKLLRVYRDLKQLKNLEYVDFNEVYDYVGCSAAEEKKDGHSSDSVSKSFTWTHEIQRKVEALPDEWLTLIVSENLIDQSSKIVSHLPKSRQVLVRKFLSQPAGELSEPVKSVIKNHLVKCTGGRAE